MRRSLVLSSLCSAGLLVSGTAGQGCAPRSGLPPPSSSLAPPPATVLVEERPADPQVIADYLERRKAEGASPEEIARLEGLLAVARAFVAADGIRASVPPDQAPALYDLLRLSSGYVAREAREVLAGEGGSGTSPKEEGLAFLAGTGAPDLDLAIARASESGDSASLLALSDRLTSEEWERLSLASLWTLCQTLVSEQRYAEAIDRLAIRLQSMEGEPGAAELRLSLARWLTAAGRETEAREALALVVAEQEPHARLVGSAQEMSRVLEGKATARERELWARLLEAEATFQYGTDLKRAITLAQNVKAQAPGTPLARRAESVLSGVETRAAQIVDRELADVWKEFEAGAALDPLLARLTRLAARIPSDAQQTRIVRAREDLRGAEMDRAMGRLKAREEELSARFGQAEAAEKAGDLEEAAKILRSLADTSRREEALSRLATVIDKLARAQREKASRLFERALKEKDLPKRLAALEAVEKMLVEFLDRFPQYSEKTRVEKDLGLVRSELERTKKALPPPPATPANSDADGKSP
ncbi:MAG: hypothetical protein AB1405_00285 [Bdellovibrionota bacterium]